MKDTAAKRDREPARFWPFTTLTALVLAATVLIVLLAAWVFVREPLHAESAPTEQVLLGILLLSLIPIILLTLEGVASRGGSVEVWKVRIALTAASGSRATIVAIPNVAPDTNDLRTSSSRSIIKGLRGAAAAGTAIEVDLKDGHAWWESRLLILCVGAARLGRPDVIVFTGAREAKVGQFIGWAHPAAIRERILRENPDFNRAYETATGLAALIRQRYATGEEILKEYGPDERKVEIYGVDITVQDSAESDPAELNPFLEEQLLANAVGALEVENRRKISIHRLHELLEPILHVTAVDRTDRDVEWFRTALRSDEDYLAISDSGEYIALISRAEVVSEVLLAITGT